MVITTLHLLPHRVVKRPVKIIYAKILSKLHNAMQMWVITVVFPARYLLFHFRALWSILHRLSDFCMHSLELWTMININSPPTRTPCFQHTLLRGSKPILQEVKLLQNTESLLVLSSHYLAVGVCMHNRPEQEIVSSMKGLFPKMLQFLM